MVAKTESPPKRQFGFKDVPLPKDQYGLDEDGYIWLKTRLKVKDAMKAQSIPESDIVGWLVELIGGWSIKMDGIELPYTSENIEELPFEILQLIRTEVIDPLATALPESPTESEKPENE
jgi:hypothetical protein|tara:strand:- start:355 stop:711 length:357 start_codon:yes stop_codon:yes gene_type:complete